MYEDIMKEMRRKCRLAMDGMKSTSMRMYGLDYKLNFGLLIQQIKEIAGGYEESSELAEALWNQSTRELIILATFLYPKEQFVADTASRWAKTIPNQEVREQVCVNLFQELDFADQLAIEWANDEDIEIRITGYWLMTRLLLTKKFEGVLNIEYFKYIWEDVISDNIFIRNASLLVAKHVGRQSKEAADAILQLAAPLKDSSDPLQEEAYNSLAFEFGFIWGE